MVKEYGYEYDAALNEAVWNETKGLTAQQTLFGAKCLRSGRDALKAIAREYAPCQVFLPALACDSMVIPFEMYGHHVRYYKLREDYSVDMKDWENSIGNEKVLFLYMDYFGIPAIGDRELQRLRETYVGMVFIEDKTHTFLRRRKTAFQPDYSVASLRKWIPVPDGGLLWGTVTHPFGSDTSFAETRLKAQCMRHTFLRCGDETLKTRYRKIFSTVSDIMDADIEPSAMSLYSYELARAVDWEELRNTRQRNAEALIAALSDCPHVCFIQDRVGMSDLYVVFTVRHRDEIQRRLSSEGIFNTIIWPLSGRQKEHCPVAAFTEEHMLAAPCDQRYTADEMKYIGKEMEKVITDVSC